MLGGEVAVGTPHCFGVALLCRVEAGLTDGLRRRGEFAGLMSVGDGVRSSEAIPCIADQESPKKADSVAGD
jgi:hypothetical protein